MWDIAMEQTNVKTTFFVFSVLPAPLSPVISIDWFLLLVDRSQNIMMKDERNEQPVFEHIPVGSLSDSPLV